jgi:hypothetical protein
MNELFTIRTPWEENQKVCPSVNWKTSSRSTSLAFRGLARLKVSGPKPLSQVTPTPAE